MATRRKTPPGAPYAPQVGELVRDTMNGVNGVYVGPSYTTKNAAELMPVGGGVAWDTPAGEVQPVSAVPKLVLAFKPDKRYQAAGRRTGEGAA